MAVGRVGVENFLNLWVLVSDVLVGLKKLQMYSLVSCCYKLSYERVLKPATSLLIHGILATFCDMSRGQNIPQIGVAQL